MFKRVLVEKSTKEVYCAICKKSETCLIKEAVPKSFGYIKFDEKLIKDSPLYSEHYKKMLLDNVNKFVESGYLSKLVACKACIDEFELMKDIIL